MQAARIMFPAKGIHLAPPEPKESRSDRDARLKRDAAIRERELAERVKKDKIESEAEIAQKKATQKEARSNLSEDWFARKMKLRDARMKRRKKKLKGTC